MRSPKLIIALTAAALLLSFSIAIACNDKAEKTKDCVEAVNATSDAAAEKAPAADAGCKTTEQAKSSATMIKTSLRAGVNLTKALYRAAGHVAMAMARTVHATISALS